MTIPFRSFLPRITGITQESRPVVTADHSSSRSGVFICGDLAGKPTLKTSIKDGYETMASVGAFLAKKKHPANCPYDVVICGAGGAGLAAAFEAKKLGLRYIALEKNKIAHTIRNFPAGKKIWARQEKIQLDTELWLDNCTKEELLENWLERTGSKNISIQEGKELTGIADTADGFDVHTADGASYRCAAVIVSIGRGGNPRHLNIAGEELDHVHHMLQQPHGYEGRKVMIVGGGNSAVEAAIALAENGAQVSISYRQDDFFRITAMNRTEIDATIASGRVKAFFNSNPEAIDSGSITLKTKKGTERVTADEVFILVGAEPPRKLLEHLGLSFENQWNAGRIAQMAAVLALFWLYYAFAKWGDGTGIREFPFSLLGNSRDVLPHWFNTSIATSLLYTIVVIGFGIPAFLRWRSLPRICFYQTARFIVLFLSQAVFLFLLPEYILPMFDPENAWRFYGVLMPFPLTYGIFFDRPPLFWACLCAAAGFVALPILIRYHGKRLCSWVCGCACLAETLGDRYRHCAPQGELSRRIENPLMWAVLIWSAVSAGLFLLLQSGVGYRPWHVAAYSYIIDFWLAGVFGVGLYFFLGNRIWCRYFCPLAHYMRLLSSWYGKFRIKPADRCIACGECSRYCQMGIDVMKWALKQTPVTNRNSSCIGCGICVSVCPMDNLTMGERFPNEEAYDA